MNIGSEKMDEKIVLDLNSIAIECGLLENIESEILIKNIENFNL